MDSWKIDDTSVILKDNFPRLYSFVLNDQMSAAQVFNLEDFSTILYLPLSISAYGELVELQTLMELIRCWIRRMHGVMHGEINIILYLQLGTVLASRFLCRW
jgi:hypothetical protein